MENETKELLRKILAYINENEEMGDSCAMDITYIKSSNLFHFISDLEE